MLSIGHETVGGLYPFTAHYRTVNGVRIHFVDEGGGEPVVLLHGDPTWGFLYRNFIPPLARRYRCIVPDHMGMGKSETPVTPYPYRLSHHVGNLEALLLELDLRQMTLVLHDWGGPVGLGGMRDPVLTPEVLRWWQGQFPQAVSRAAEDASHFLREDAPEQTVEWIEEFLGP